MTYYYEVAPTKLIRIGSDSFTYSSDRPLNIGQIVLVEIGKKQITGVIIEKTKKPTYAVKQIDQVLYETPLPIQCIKVAKWISSYYIAPLYCVIQTLLPAGIQKKRRAKVLAEPQSHRQRTTFLFNDEQTSAINRLSDSADGTFLLQGVTGSGKTAIYIALAQDAIKAGKSAIILVPEIALTSQIVDEFLSSFPDVILTHSQLAEPERHAIWAKVLNSDRPLVVVGPRSALFLPIKDLGIIIVDEAHEPSYKQEKMPKYSALRVATMLGRFHNCKVVFGSATPNIVDRFLADQSDDDKVIKLTKPARPNSQPPKIEIIDMTKNHNSNGHRFFSSQLLINIDQTLKSGNQVLIFHNRRGSASTTLCKSCGWIAQCPNCFIPLTLHADRNLLMCHVCGHKTKAPTSCPQCGDTEIIFKGIGTKLIEHELKKLYPAANIARFDADNLAKDTVNNRYQDLYDGTIDIAIGTQVVAKGLDLPKLRTIGIIQADTGLNLPDFSSGERTFQLIAQVIGRVGRNDNKTNVIIQSYQVSHPSIKFGISQNYEDFYEYALTERKASLFPPYTYLLKLVCSYKTESGAVKNAQKVAQQLRNQVDKSVQVFGPTPAFYERQNGAFRWQLILKSQRRENLIGAVALLPTSHWQYEIDPTSLL